MTRSLLFYPGVGLSGLLIRRWTRSAYAHVAIRIGDIVVEALAGGVQSRPFEPSGRDAGAAKVDLPRECWATRLCAGDQFLSDQVGKPYDWQAVAFDVLGVLLGRRAELNIAGDGCWDCSRLAAATLTAWGWLCPQLAGLRGPVAPGDLYRLLTI